LQYNLIVFGLFSVSILVNMTTLLFTKTPLQFVLRICISTQCRNKLRIERHFLWGRVRFKVQFLIIFKSKGNLQHNLIVFGLFSVSILVNMTTLIFTKTPVQFVFRICISSESRK